MKIKIKLADDQQRGIRSSKDLDSLFREVPIDDRQIAVAMNLFFQNACELADEAKILFEAKRYARAFSLAVLSLEELAKPVLLANAVVFEKNDNEAWRLLWKVLRSHESKQWVWSAYGERLETWKVPKARSYRDRFPAGVTALLERFKQAGFYVSYFSQSGFILPNKLAADNEKWVKKLIRFVDRRIAAFSNLHGSEAKSLAFVRLSRSLMPKEIKGEFLRTLKATAGEMTRGFAFSPKKSTR